MRTVNAAEDVHFYLDNAAPDEVQWVLRCLSKTDALSPQMIGERLSMDYGFQMQKDRTYSPRRLYDLGLACQTGTGARVSYVLTPAGASMQNLMALDSVLYSELMHFLHYSRYDGQPTSRKYLWSYRQCCEVIWAEGRFVPTQELAATIQGFIREEFPYLDFGARRGARFDSTAAGRFYTWVRQLSPPPFQEEEGVSLIRRIVDRYELALVALDHVYAIRQYRYGDPVVLDEVLLDELARVFFLEHQCVRNLLDLAARMTRTVVLHDTFAGTSVNLMAPYGVENV